MYGRDTLIDVMPGGLGEYQFPINHETEDEFGGERSIEHTAPTSNVGAVRQQGDDGPLVMRLQGRILHKAMHQTLQNFFEQSRTRTMRFRDFEGEEYEVLITAYKAKRQGVVLNSKDLTNARLHIYSYTLQMEIIRVISGTWA